MIRFVKGDEVEVLHWDQEDGKPEWRPAIVVASSECGNLLTLANEDGSVFTLTNGNTGKDWLGVTFPQKIREVTERSRQAIASAEGQ